MQELLAAGVAGIDRPHRLLHMIVTIHLVDEGDSGLRVFMGAGNNPIPDVGRVDHTRTRRFLNRAVGKIRIDERLLVRERDSRTIRASIDKVITIAYWIVNRIRPRLAVKLELKPFVVINGLEELVGHVYRDIEIRE